MVYNQCAILNVDKTHYIQFITKNNSLLI